jgi:hypothetical protein
VRRFSAAFAFVDRDAWPGAQQKQKRRKSAALHMHEFVRRYRRESGASAICSRWSKYLAGRLRPAPPPQCQVLTGFVETLNGRPNADNRPEGQVTLRVITPEGELRARVELNAEQYAIADRLHMQNLPFSLEGLLHHRRVGQQPVCRRGAKPGDGAMQNSVRTIQDGTVSAAPQIPGAGASFWSSFFQRNGSCQLALAVRV